ncbi:MAG: aldo/keto reductase [Alphaproteobacteria bacterium]|nr:aldo/keto reductase [Alphaproteobacteria bacterium]
MMDNRIDRRRLLQVGAGAGLAAGVLPASARAEAFAQNRVQSYVTLGRTGLMIADISFGSSRLRTGEEAVVRHALDKGINYFDTAESYTKGASEEVLGRALKGVRDEVILATKTGAGAGTRADEIMRNLEASLKRLQTDHVEVFFNHAVNEIDRLHNEEWHAFVDRAKAQGKIRFTGMSGHGGNLIQCLDYGIDNDILDVMLVAYNFGQDPKFYEGLTKDFDFVATQPDLPRVIEKAKTKDVGVIAMKTLRGARLNDMRPFEQGTDSFAQAAFRWVLSNPNVDALIVSMTSSDLIDEYLGASGAQELGANDLPLLHRYAKMNGDSFCRHACNACEGSCPYGVQIADVLRTRMYAMDYRDMDFARAEYAMLEVNGSACLSCSGEPCRNACPYGLKIDELCAPTHVLLI